MTASNTLLLLGTLTEPPEVLQTKNGKLWIKLLIEIRSWRRGSDGEAGQEDVTFISVNLFSRVAETARAYLQPGDPVALSCRISGTEFKSADGKVRRGTTVTCDQLHLIPSGRRVSSDRPGPSAPREGAML